MLAAKIAWHTRITCYTVCKKGHGRSAVFRMFYMKFTKSNIIGDLNMIYYKGQTFNFRNAVIFERLLFFKIKFLTFSGYKVMRWTPSVNINVHQTVKDGNARVAFVVSTNLKSCKDRFSSHTDFNFQTSTARWFLPRRKNTNATDVVRNF